MARGSVTELNFKGSVTFQKKQQALKNGVQRQLKKVLKQKALKKVRRIKENAQRRIKEVISQLSTDIPVRKGRPATRIQKELWGLDKHSLMMSVFEQMKRSAKTKEQHEWAKEEIYLLRIDNALHGRVSGFKP